MSETLGDLLRARQAQDELEQNARIKAEAQAAANERERLRLSIVKEVDDYFDGIKSKVTDALLAGKQIPHIGMPQDHNHRMYDILSPTARVDSCYHDTNVGNKSWEAFRTWATENGMHVWWETDPYEHTPGYVSHTYCTLHFTPLKTK